jgi:malic enzyme
MPRPRPDAIVATGRSDYPNQVNNVLGFPFIFRGALDVRATAINEEMKIAAATAIAELAREQVPEEVAPPMASKYQLRARLHHPRTVRSAPDGSRILRRRQGGDGFAASRKSRSRISTPIARASRPAQPDHLGADPRL